MRRIASRVWKWAKYMLRLRRPDRTAQSLVQEGLLQLEAIGSQSELARGCEVHILEYRRGPQLDEVVDLASIPLDGSWHLVDGVSCGPITLNAVIKSEHGTIRIPFSGHARLTFLSHPWSGFVSIAYKGEPLRIDLFSKQTITVSYDLYKDPISNGIVIKPSDNLLSRPQHLTRDRTQEDAVSPLRVNAPTRNPLPPVTFRFQQHADTSNPYHDRTREVLSVVTPRWKGVTRSTQLFFSNRLYIPSSELHTPDQITDDLSKEAATEIANSQYRDIVFSGGDLFQLRIAHMLKKVKRCHLLWHSNYLQTGETHDWGVFRQWLHAQREGIISRIAVVRRGYHHYLQTIGFEALFIPNQLPHSDILPGIRVDDDTIGIWLSGSSAYRKSADIMIAAVASLSTLKLKIAGCTPRDLNLLRYGITEAPFVSARPLPFDALRSEMASVALNLYVTASESSPMLPLESFALGVPCIIGANSHLFKDDEFLSKMLRVSNIGSSSEIANKITLCLNSRSEILQRYSLYANSQVRIALSGLEKLLTD